MRIEKVYMHGIAGNGNSVITALEMAGGKNSFKFNCDRPDLIYYINSNGDIYAADSVYGSEDDKEICRLVEDNYTELKNIYHDGPVLFKPLKPFEKVIVRNNNNEMWKADIFSHLSCDNSRNVYNCVGGSYKYCLPYNEKIAKSLKFGIPDKKGVTEKYVELAYWYKDGACITKCPYRETPNRCIKSYMCSQCAHYHGTDNNEKGIFDEDRHVCGLTGTIRCSWIYDKEKEK